MVPTKYNQSTYDIYKAAYEKKALHYAKGAKCINHDDLGTDLVEYLKITNQIKLKEYFIHSDKLFRANILASIEMFKLFFDNLDCLKQDFIASEIGADKPDIQNVAKYAIGVIETLLNSILSGRSILRSVNKLSFPQVSLLSSISLNASQENTLWYMSNPTLSPKYKISEDQTIDLNIDPSFFNEYIYQLNIIHDANERSQEILNQLENLVLDLRRNAIVFLDDLETKLDTIDSTISQLQDEKADLSNQLEEIVYLDRLEAKLTLKSIEECLETAAKSKDCSTFIKKDVY